MSDPAMDAAVEAMQTDQPAPTAMTALTEEQIADLKTRYDMNNMDLGQMKALGKELLDLGVISEEEFRTWGMMPTALSGPAGLVQDSWKGYDEWVLASEKSRAYQPGDDLIQHLLDQIGFGKSNLSLLADNEKLLAQRDGIFAEQDQSGETARRTNDAIGQVQRTLDILSLLK
jgi:hypothetical protein